MIYIPEFEDIYFVKTQEYFNEVVSSYTNGNYRSAVVMLYSVVICDLLFKLQELKDMYNDTIAVEILSQIEKCRNPEDNKSKSRWEKELVDIIYKRTELIDSETYTNINHLYDHRNFSAHPALNDNYELVSPSKETTIAHIKNMLDNILIKPPIFIKNVVDLITEDLSEKRSIYQDQPEKLRDYLSRKYFDRMSESMKKNTFRSFWKLCFCLPEDENCMKNIAINRRVLECLADITQNLLDYMKTDSLFARTSLDNNCILQLCILLARYPNMYTVISEDTKLQIGDLIKRNTTAQIISWFCSPDKKTHIQSMIDNTNFGSISEDTIEFVTSHYLEEGILPSLVDYLIEYFSDSSSFDVANNRYNYAIKPYLSILSRDQFIRVINAVNSNHQIYGRNASKDSNTEIVIAAKDVLGSDFGYSSYSNFKFYEEKAFSPGNMTEFEKDNYDDELPF